MYEALSGPLPLDLSPPDRLAEQARLQQAYEECRALRIPGTVCTPPPQVLPDLVTTAPMPLSPWLLALGALSLLGGRK